MAIIKVYLSLKRWMQCWLLAFCRQFIPLNTRKAR